MSNWDLMMPGMGLVAIGVAGVALSYAEIAHTFIDGMHALTGLTLFIGLIFLGAGILEGGVSTSRKAKITTLILVGIGIGVGLTALQASQISTVPLFAGILFVIVSPAVIIAYVAMKVPQFVKSVTTIMIITTFALVVILIAFGMPEEEIVEETPEVVEEKVEVEPGTPVFPISILEGSAEQGKPDYEPDVAVVSQGFVIEWINEDQVAHTVTSSVDFGETFDSGLMGAGEKFLLDTNELALGEYEYMCIVHPWMIASIVIEEPKEAVTVEVIIPEGAGFQNIDQIYYDPQELSVEVGTTVIWQNKDSTIHTVTSGLPSEGPSGSFDSGMVSAGDSFEYTFTTAGTEDYFCIVHPWMVGSVTVG